MNECIQMEYVYLHSIQKGIAFIKKTHPGRDNGSRQFSKRIEASCFAVRMYIHLSQTTHLKISILFNFCLYLNFIFHNSKLFKIKFKYYFSSQVIHVITQYRHPFPIFIVMIVMMTRFMLSIFVLVWITI